MKSPVLATLALLVTAPAVQAAPPSPNPGYKQPVRYEALKKGFSNPDMLFAPFAFWFWDEPLDTAKMARMAATMASQGMNPGYAHARMSMVGTPSLPPEQWLGEPWFAAFRASLGEATKRKAYLGYCDEYWWPSFQANGRVLKQHPELKALSLSWSTIDSRGGKSVAIPDCFVAVAAPLVASLPVGDRQPVHARMGQWIWAAGATPTEHSCHLRAYVEIPTGRTIASTSLRITCDNAFDAFIDGKRVGGSDDWHVVREFDVKPMLAPGRHVLAVEARNLDGGYGLTAGLAVQYSDGTVQQLVTDSSWRASLEHPETWAEPGFDDSRWARAAVIAEPGSQPWNLPAEAGSEHRIATIRSSGLRIIGQGKAFKWQAPAGSDWRVYAYSKYSHPGVDGGQVNCLDERLAPAFIKIALEPYAKRMGSAMGKGIPGDFTDHEGAYGWRVAWSDTLARKYRARYGVDLRLQLPLLSDPDREGKYAAVRWRWFDLVSELYAGQFAALARWHEARGMSTTAHVWEESMPAQIVAVADHMRLLRALTMPGQDCLGTKALEVHDFKEIQSVAEFGGRRAATELMGAGGWSTMTPAFLKQSINAITAWGMGHVIPHAVFATRKMTGNPWPPDFYIENPMFPYLHLWNDFIRRACYVNSHGHAVPDVLLYNPIETLWTLSDARMNAANADVPGLAWTWPEDRPSGQRANAIDRAYSHAMHQLTEARVEFLVGDRYEVGKMAAQAGTLTSGPLVFKTVVLPPMDILPLSVARKLALFAEQGGRVYALGELPSASAENGVGDPEMRAAMTRLAAASTFSRCEPEPARARSRWDYGPGWTYVTEASSFGLAPLLASGAPGLVSPVRFLSGEFAMLQQRRVVDGRLLFWLANNTGKPQDCEVEIDGVTGMAEKWDCEAGSVLPQANSGAPNRFRLHFDAYEGYWLAMGGSGTAKPHASAQPTVLATLDGPWTGSIDRSIQPDLELPVAVDPALYTASPWRLGSWHGRLPERFSGLVDYTTQFDLPATAGRVVLDLGKVAHVAEVTVNGRKCGARIWPPYVVEITPALLVGRNNVTVRVGNLVNNSYGDIRESGLYGPVRVVAAGE